MKLRDVKRILDAEVLCGENLLGVEITRSFACDLISEMLIYLNPNSLLITSLTNAHVHHTAQVMDAAGVIFVGRKRPDETTIRNCELSNIPLLSTPYLTFECCGLLYKNGIEGDK